MKILVTGGTGYIGSHTAVELINKGYDVIVLDNLYNSYESVIDSIEQISGKRPEFVNIDLCDKESLFAFLAHSKIEAIIHFAAYKAVGESVEKPLNYYRNNLNSTMNLLEGMEKFRIRDIVFSSSCSVYGEPDELPVKETTPLKRAESPYANTKQICEEIISDFVRVSSIRAISLRYFNPIGAHPSALIGEYPLSAPTNLVPVITQTAIGKRKEVQVFGDDYNTPDGSCIRDYIHVVDIAKAHVEAIERMINNKMKSECEVFNLGTGRGNSVLEVITTFEKVSNTKLNYKIAPRRPGDVVQVYADTTLANKELGWKAESSLEDAIASAWKWEQHLAKMEKINS